MFQIIWSLIKTLLYKWIKIFLLGFYGYWRLNITPISSHSAVLSVTLKFALSHRTWHRPCQGSWVCLTNERVLWVCLTNEKPVSHRRGLNAVSSDISRYVLNTVDESELLQSIMNLNYCKLSWIVNLNYCKVFQRKESELDDSCQRCLSVLKPRRYIEERSK